jgi:hypothetical protein
MLVPLEAVCVALGPSVVTTLEPTVLVGPVATEVEIYIIINFRNKV